MELKQKIKSTEDETIKYIFEINNQVVEFSYIDNGTGKDIICVPCQTMCNMSCKFCHLTDHVGKIPLKNMTASQIVTGVKRIAEDLGLGERELLISYMGCGEPLDNVESVMTSMKIIKKKFDNVRFGLATMLPKKSWSNLLELAGFVNKHDINLKIHLSLHFVDDDQRKEWMPSALGIIPSIDLLNTYHDITGNPIEVHYTIMDGVNDSEYHIGKLHKLLKRECIIKFMMYSERDTIDVQRASEARIDKSIHYLEGLGYTAEYYEPPGNDIGASCGQFLMQYEKQKTSEEVLT